MYFEDRKLHNRSNNREFLRYKKHLYEIFGNTNIDTISVESIKKYQSQKATYLAPKTVNNILNLMSVIFNFAIENDLFQKENPLKKVKRQSVDNQRERFLTKKEIELLFSKVKENNMLYLFCLLSLSTGGRLSTILNIKVKDINLTLKTITLKNIKNNTTYNGFIMQKLHPLLQRYIKSLNPDDYIFNIDGKILNISYIRDRLQPILDQLFNQGLDTKDTKNRVVIHTLRHTFASHLAIKGTPIYTIKTLMDHNDIKTTMRYAKLAPDSGLDMVVNLYS